MRANRLHLERSLTSDTLLSPSRNGDPLDRPIAPSDAALEESEWAPAGRTPKEFAIQPLHEGGFRISILSHTMPIWMLLLWLVAPVVFILMGITGSAPMIFPLGGGLFAFAGVGAFVWDRISQRELEIRQDRIEVYYTVPWGEVARESLRSADIKNVSIRRNRQGQFVLAVEGEAGSLETAERVPGEALEWLKRLVVKILRVEASDAVRAA